MIRTELVKDVFSTYTYFYIDEVTKHGFLIDPGAEAEKLLEIIRTNGWNIEKILLTHGHFDHTGAVEKLHRELKIPYYIHENGKQYLESTHYNLSRYCHRNVVLKDAIYQKDGDIIRLEANPEFSLQILHVPGHSMDSVLFYAEKEGIAFVGDSIFKEGLADVSYPGSNPLQYQKSLVKVIFQLPPKTIIYPGHSEATTIETEIRQYTK